MDGRSEIGDGGTGGGSDGSSSRRGQSRRGPRAGPPPGAVWGGLGVTAGVCWDWLGEEGGAARGLREAAREVLARVDEDEDWASVRQGGRSCVSLSVF